MSAAPAAVHRPLERAASRGTRLPHHADSSCWIRRWNSLATLAQMAGAMAARRPPRRASACGTAVKRGGHALPTPKQEPLFPRTRLKLRRVRSSRGGPSRRVRAESLHAEAPYQPPKASSGAGAHRRHRNRRASMPFPGIWIKLQRHIIIAGETDGSELSSSGVDARTGREPVEANVRS